MTQHRAFLIGYGNPAHGDDGLGPAFAEQITMHQLQGLTVQSDYQLSADHAHDMAQHDVVVFVDALMNAPEPFIFREIVDPQPQALGSHTVTPEAALALCTLLFQAKPRTFVLGIHGSQFDDIREGLSPAAQANLQAALSFFEDWYRFLLTQGHERQPIDA